MAESFFGLLKRERVHRRQYQTRAEARVDFFDYIEGFCNRHRGHSFTQGGAPRIFIESYHQKSWQSKRPPLHLFQTMVLFGLFTFSVKMQMSLWWVGNFIWLSTSLGAVKGKGD